MTKLYQRGEMIELAQGDGTQTNVRTIQVLRPGHFVDMHGAEIQVTGDDLDTYIANSTARLASEQVPIELGHPDDVGAPAAAWYRKFFKRTIEGIDWVCADIELSALGAQALADQLYKYFSANLDLSARVICGGGFVNRPAVSGQQTIGALAQYLYPKPNGGESNMNADSGKEKQSALQFATTLLKRALGIAQLEMSQEDVKQKLYTAIRAKYTDAMMGDMPMSVPYIVATYADRVIVQKEEDYFALPYTLDAQGDVTLGDPVEVEVTWTPKANETSQLAAPIPNAPVPPPSATLIPITTFPNATLTTSATVALASNSSSNPNSQQGGESKMSQTTTNPVTNPAPEALGGVPAVTIPVTPVDPSLPVDEQIRLAREQAAESATAQARAFEAKLAQVREEERARVQMEMTRRQEVAALSQKWTSGKRQLPFTPQQLDEMLLKLSDADRAIVAPFLSKIQDAGLVELGELGSAANGRGAKQLPDNIKPYLVAHLSKGGTVADFFAANVELGKSEQYDLYEFQK